MQNKNESKSYTETSKTIARQSNMKWLLDYTKSLNTKLTMSEIVRITEALTIYVVDGRNDQVVRMMEEVDKLILTKFEDA
jgi:16S rRNA U516 pseudouridylate synthase RsuA-like enzyme